METQVGTLLPTLLFSLVAKSRPDDNKMQDWESSCWFLARRRVRRVTRRQARDEVDRSSGVILGDSLSSKSTACLPTRRCVWRGTCAPHTCLVCRYSRCSFISVFSARASLPIRRPFSPVNISLISLTAFSSCTGHIAWLLPLRLVIEFFPSSTWFSRRTNPCQRFCSSCSDSLAFSLSFSRQANPLCKSVCVCETPGELNCVLVSPFCRPLWRN